MKRSIRILMIVLCTLILLGVGISLAFRQVESNLLNLIALPVLQAMPLSLADGTYEGSYSTFPIKVRVQVHVLDQRIQVISLLEHRNGQGEAAEAILKTIVANQSLAIDTVSGATYSSIVILKAVEQALAKAERL
ncbi:MAG: FMN-binding protein [Spirochaetales bacterium]|nr:FMN-binding protein [Spirochaetales bacterium]